MSENIKCPKCGSKELEEFKYYTMECHSSTVYTCRDCDENFRLKAPLTYYQGIMGNMTIEKLASLLVSLNDSSPFRCNNCMAFDTCKDESMPCFITILNKLKSPIQGE